MKHTIWALTALVVTCIICATAVSIYAFHMHVSHKDIEGVAYGLLTLLILILLSGAAIAGLSLPGETTTEDKKDNNPPSAE